MYAVGSRILYCVVLAYRQKKRNTIDVLKKKKDNWVPNQNTMQKKKMWHISNQMPFIKYSKLHHGFKSVPRKKDTFKKPYFDLVLTPLFERCVAGSLRNVLIWNK